MTSRMVEFEGTMNRFRLALAFVFLVAASLSLVAYLALQLGAGPAPEETQLLLWSVLRSDGLFLAGVLVLLGLGWAYFGKIFATEGSAKPA
jgi:hypothetical protein